MTSQELDAAFAQQLNQLGMVTLDQIEEARRLQRDAAARGQALSLPDALVLTDAITQAIKENVLKQVQAHRQGGLQQLGQYKLIKKLGEGGMGSVFLAEDTMLQRKVAVKVLPRKFSSDEQFLSRFRREARAAGNLNHPNICGAYAVGEEQGNHYYVMEFCEGEPLDVVLKRAQVFPWDEGLRIILDVARGLQFAHQQGFIHRDIKPGNIFMTTEGAAKILDLGLSKSLGDNENTSFQTQTGVTVGTPHYISPEQAQALPDVDGRTDIYSLGATLYHMVTGQTPYKGSAAAQIILKHINEQLPNPLDLNPDIPDGLVHIIEKMMAKRPEDRYSDCGELIIDIELVLAGQAPSSQALAAALSSIAMPKAPRAEGNRVGTGKNLLPVRRGTTGTRLPPIGRVTTGKREPIEPREESSRTSRRVESQPKGVYIGVGVGIALLLVVLAWAFSGPSKTASSSQDHDKTSHPVDAGSAVGAITTEHEGPAATTPRDAFALKRWLELKEQRRAGGLSDVELRKRISEFVAAYRDTEPGKEAAEFLAQVPAAPKVLQPVKPAEPAKAPVVPRTEVPVSKTERPVPPVQTAQTGPFIAKWEKLGKEAPTPGGRAYVTTKLAYDSKRKRSVLWGGENRNDMWAFDLESRRWTQLEPNDPKSPENGKTRPGPMLLAGMQYDAQRDQYWLDEAWAFAPSTGKWTAETRIASGAPVNQVRKRAVYDPTHGLFWGIGETRGNPTWWYYSFDPTTARVEKFPAPFPKRRWIDGGMAFDQKSERVIIFGGDAGKFVNDTWIFNIRDMEWKESRCSIRPSARIFHELTWNAVIEAIVMVGGNTIWDKSVMDLWVYEPGKDVWTEVPMLGAPPPSGAYGASCYDVAHDKMVYFDRNGDTWTLEIKRAGEQRAGAKEAIQTHLQSAEALLPLAPAFDPATHERWVPGLAGTYFKDPDFREKAVTRADVQLNFDWKDGSPTQQIPTDNFSVRWEGKLHIAQAGKYRFFALADDMLKTFQVDKKPVLQGRFGPDKASAPMDLKAGDHDILIEYIENGGGASCVLYWESEQIKKQVIPPEAYLHDASLTNTIVAKEQPPQAPSPQGSNGWTPIFNGKDLGFLSANGEGTWIVANGALEKVPGKNSAAQTRASFGDGEIRIRFAADANATVIFSVRQGAGGRFVAQMAKTDLEKARNPEHELIFRCEGEEVSATLNGQPWKVTVDQGKQKDGRIQFNSQNGTMRLFALEHRSLVAIQGDDQKQVVSPSIEVKPAEPEQQSVVQESSKVEPPLAVDKKGAKDAILWECWDSIGGGNEVAVLTRHPSFPFPPSESREVASFEAPSNRGDNYGSRMRGFIHPPVDGDYVFWITSDDGSELWLSTDEERNNIQKIAELKVAKGPRDWEKDNSQRSANIALRAGQKYYIEAVHKEGGGYDHIAVGWQLPNGSLERPIPGMRLSPCPSTKWVALEISTASAKKPDTKFLKQKDGSMLVAGATPRNDTYTIGARPDLKNIIAIRLEVLPDETLPSRGAGRADNGNFALTEFKVFADGKVLALKPNPRTDYHSKDCPPANVLDDKDNTYWSVGGQIDKAHAVVFEPVRPFSAVTLGFVLAHDSRWPDHNIGRFRLSVAVSQQGDE